MTSDEWLNFFEHPDVFAFCAKIAENPDDLAPKLVFADWLEENCPDERFVKGYREAVAEKHNIELPIHPDDFGGNQKLSENWHGVIELLPIGQFKVKEWVNVECLQRLIRSGMVGAVTIPNDRFHELVLPETLHTLKLKGEQPPPPTENFDFSHIRHLDFHNQFFYTADLSFLEQGHLPNLEHLELGGHNLTDHYFVRLASHPILTKVKTLMLSQNFISGEGMEAIANSPFVQNVETLTLTMNQLELAGARAILNSPNLSKLKTLFWVAMHIENDDASIEIFREIATNPNTSRLETFGLSSRQCPTSCWNDFFATPHFQNLSRMLIYLAKVQNESLNVFLNSSSFPKLETFHLNGAAIDDEGAYAIANAPRMQTITDFSLKYCNKITSLGRRAMMESPYLIPSAKESLAKSWE